MNDLTIRTQELFDNPTPRVPIVLCLDVSGSMRGEKIQELNKGVRDFIRAVQADETAASSASLAVVTFSTGARMIQDYTTVETIHHPAEITIAEGLTYLGAGVNLSLDLLDRQKALFKSTGVDYYQPWIVIMTDGAPCGEADSLWRQAAARCCQMESQRKLVVLPIGIGNDANLSVLGNFSRKQQAQRLSVMQFSSFFKWLSASTINVSRSRTDEDIRISFNSSSCEKI